MGVFIWAKKGKENSLKKCSKNIDLEGHDSGQIDFGGGLDPKF